MKVLVITDHGYPGGANIACWRLIEGLCALGIQVVHGNLEGAQDPVCRSDYYSTENFFGGKAEALATTAERFSKHSWAHLIRQRDLLKQIPATLQRVQPNVIHLHNLHACPLALDFLESIPTDLPVVWTLHDQWSFTGRCAYAYDCERFIKGCDSTCPTPEEAPALEPGAIAPAWKRKRDLLAARSHWSAITPSRWMALEAERGFWKGHRVAAIANGLPLDVFFPGPKDAAKSLLGLDPNVPTALASASNLAERRKGGELLAAVLQKLNRPLQVLSLGDASLTLRNPQVTIRHLGFLKDTLAQRLAYTAADLLLHPAPVDNLPNVVAEAAACGTPALSFGIGGLPEMVKPGKTGWLCPSHAADAFKHTLEQVLEDPTSLRALSSSCREWATRHYDLAKQTEVVLGFYQKVLA